MTSRLRLRFADDTLIDSDRTDRLPVATDLATELPESVTQTSVLLALPLAQANGGNCLPQEQAVTRPVRYRRDWRDVQDHYGEDRQSIAVLEHALSLRLDRDDNAEYITCPTARLVRDAQGVWALDESFQPPMLAFDAHAGLLQQLDNLLTQLAAKRSRLMAMCRENNQRMADFAVADVSLFWLLNALNTFQSALNDLTAYPARPPELVYQQLSKLAGRLLTFSLEHDIEAILAYQHTHPERVFPALFRLISTLLEASLPSRVIALKLKLSPPTVGKFRRKMAVCATVTGQLLPVGALLDASCIPASTVSTPVKSGRP
ncbi:type VI secretion protein, TssK family [Pseudomonas chlororaphis O6]|uniref:Type VI secretion protein, TssK family n=1 Tax=Pseudomonas chlororaphis O6 TaxID=1037915 RepID=A0AB33X066_9PSED|nr:type VI secretion protein, TssK family [Pseudomonas chlororaphis O6]